MTRKNDKGFTLVEILVAMLIATTLMLAVIRLFTRVGETFEMNADAMQLMETTRVALKFVKNDLTQAGYMGCVQTDIDPAKKNLGVLLETAINKTPSSYWGVSGQDGGANPDTLSMFYMQDLDIRVLKVDVNGAVSGVPSLIVDSFNVFDGRGVPKIRTSDWLVVSNCTQATSFLLTGLSSNLPPSAAMGFGADAIVTSGVTLLEYSQGKSYDGFLNQSSIQLMSNGSYNSMASGGATMLGRYFDITYVVADSVIDGGDTKSLFRLVNGDEPSKYNEVVRMVEDFQVTYGIDSDGDGVANQVVDNLAGVNANNRPVQVRVAITIAGDLNSQELVNIVKIRNKGL